MDLSTVLKKAATGDCGSLSLRRAGVLWTVGEREGELRGSNCSKIELSASAVAAIGSWWLTESGLSLGRGWSRANRMLVSHDYINEEAMHLYVTRPRL